MSGEEYLKALIERNPAIGKPDEEKITLTARGLRKIVLQAHETGYQHCIKVQETMSRLFRVPRNPF